MHEPRAGRTPGGLAQEAARSDWRAWRRAPDRLPDLSAIARTAHRRLRGFEPVRVALGDPRHGRLHRSGAGGPRLELRLRVRGAGGLFLAAESAGEKVRCGRRKSRLRLVRRSWSCVGQAPGDRRPDAAFAAASGARPQGLPPVQIVLADLMRLLDDAFVAFMSGIRWGYKNGAWNHGGGDKAQDVHDD